MRYVFNPFTGNFDLIGAAAIPDPLVVNDLAVNNLLTANHIHGNVAGALYVHVRNTSGVTLAKGAPVYIVGAVGDTTTLEVAAADAANADKTPAIGLLETALDNNQSGHAVMFGEITGFNTASYQINDELYLASGGGLTVTRPTSGHNQSLAVVGRVHATNGTVLVWVASGIPPTDLSYDAASREVRSSTGADVVLPLVSASAAGLAPAFTSATGKVLTDGGWATPTAGTPGGSNGQLQFNNNGAFGGVSTLTTDGSGNLTFSGRWINSTNGAASAPPVSLTGTWFTGGTATTTKPQFLIEPAGTTSTNWSTSGTGLGINAPSGFVGNLLDLQVNGTSYFRANIGAGAYGNVIVGTATNYLALIGDSQGRGMYANSTSGATPSGIYLWAVGQEIYLITNSVMRASITNTSLALADGINIAAGVNVGTKIGVATTQKLGFYGATPAVQPAAVADATDAATVITQLNALLSRLRTIGLIAT